jgi:RHS repeat-associated protein
MLRTRDKIVGDLLATEEPNASGSELVSYHHPDGLGTRLVTNNADTTYFEQVSLPFGTSLNAESSGSTNRRFTSYDRSAATLLDYAVNRSYDSRQGRFTQVDPIGMDSVDLSNPQSLNLYAYCGNDPINATDPSGTGWSISFGGFGGFGGGSHGGGGGLLGGLFNFGAGLLGSIFGHHGHIIGSPFIGTSQPRPPTGPVGPRPVLVSGTGTSNGTTPWPPVTHDKILALVLLGADRIELLNAQEGSREIDWSPNSIFPETFDPLEAYKHSMVPGPWVDMYGLEKATTMAKAAAAEFTASKLAIAKKYFASKYESHWIMGFTYYGMAMCIP